MVRPVCLVGRSRFVSVVNAMTNERFRRALVKRLGVAHLVFDACFSGRCNVVPASLVLDADMSAADVQDRLSGSAVLDSTDPDVQPSARVRPGNAIVVIRRRHGDTILWYVRTIDHVRSAVTGADRKKTLGALLGLHEYDASPTLDLRALRATPKPSGVRVVLDGERVVGVVQADDPSPVRRDPAPTVVERGVSRGTPSPGGDTRGMRPASRGGATRGGGTTRGAGGGTAAGEGTRDTGGTGGAGGTTRGRVTRGGRMRGIGATPGEEATSAAPGPTESGGASPTTVAQKAFPLVEAKQIVESLEPFTLTVGLSAERVTGVVAGEMTINIPAGEATATIDVQVAADEGFEAPEGWRHALVVKTSDIYAARLAIPLKAPEVTGPSLLSVLMVHFSHNGVHLGTAARRIEVAQTVAPGTNESAWVKATPSGGTLNIDLEERPPDLTIRIDKPDADESTGKFVWTFESPHDVKLPAQPLPMNLGTDAKTFSKALITLIDENQGGQLLTGTMRGIGLKIAQKIPGDLWRVLGEVAAKVAAGGAQRPVTVLLYSAETSIPWELAVMTKRLDASKPEFFGAQVALGRWILGTNGPTVPPARAVDVSRMAVITGYYNGENGLERLQGAEQESGELQQTYGALGLDASPENIRLLFDGTIDANAKDIHAIHFACHGSVNPQSPELNAIFLSDGSPLNEFVFLGAQIGDSAKPILFLNACQVGSQGEMLGESAGFGANCLYAGFRAFIAPLWSVNDVAAREIALEFYKTAFNKQSKMYVSSFFQQTRSRFVPKSPTDVPEATYLAYVYYGHPELLLSRPG